MIEEAIKRFDKVTLLSISHNNINFLSKSGNRFAKIDSSYVRSYTKPFEPSGELHLLTDEDVKEGREELFKENLLSELSTALLHNDPVSLVIVVVKNSMKNVEYIKKVEFLVRRE